METQEPIAGQAKREFSPFGIFLILLGAGLLLSRLNFVPWCWSDAVWVAVAAFGLALIVRAVFQPTRKSVFLGAFLFLLGLMILAHKWHWMDSVPLQLPADILLVIGGSFQIQYFFEPRRVGLLAGVVFFGGLGALYYLWWLDVIHMWDVRMYVKTYWPVLVILVGVGVMLKRR